MSREAFCFVPLCAALLAACGGGLQQPTPKDAEFAAARWPGTTLAHLGEGRSLYARRCGTCHALYEPAERAEPEWRDSLAEMRERAKIRPEEEELILKYLVAVGKGAVVVTKTVGSTELPASP
jgi:cytochrome c5